MPMHHLQRFTDGIHIAINPVCHLLADQERKRISECGGPIPSDQGKIEHVEEILVGKCVSDGEPLFAILDQAAPP